MLTSRHYQIEGINWLTTPNVLETPQSLTAECCRHILSDAPGAGKTHQATEAALLLSRATNSRREGAVLIIAPAHVCKDVWFKSLCEHYEHEVVWLEGTRYEKSRDANVKAKFYIVSVQSLRNSDFMVPLVEKLMIRERISCVIVDESHYVKNPEAIQAKAVRHLTRPSFCRHVILLTATPIVKEADDLYMQLRICDPIRFHNQINFLQTYCWFTMSSWGALDVTLKRGALDSLSKWLWGRTYAQIGLELPPLIADVHTHDLKPANRKAYDDIKNYWYTQLTLPGSDPEHIALNAGSAMEVMHMLRHLTNDVDKQAHLSSFIADDPGPFLVACFYRNSAKDLVAYLRQHHKHLDITVIDGSIPAPERVQMCKAATSTNSVVIATIPSISEGVDLSHCNTVYFYEEDWTPGKHYQFLSRVRRHRNSPIDPETGQPKGFSVTITEDNHLLIDENPNDRPVLVRYFHAANTIDTRIHAVLDNRAANAKDIVKVELGI